MNVSNKILSDITVYMKYAKYLPEENRRENWDELVTRNMDMHIKKYPELADDIVNAYQYVKDKKVLQKIILVEVPTEVYPKAFEIFAFFS